MTTGQSGNEAAASADSGACEHELVPTYWLASVGKYPAKEVVKVQGVRCVKCNYVRFDYDPHEDNTPASP